MWGRGPERRGGQERKGRHGSTLPIYIAKVVIGKTKFAKQIRQMGLRRAAIFVRFTAPSASRCVPRRRAWVRRQRCVDRPVVGVARRRKRSQNQAPNVGPPCGRGPAKEGRETQPSGAQPAAPIARARQCGSCRRATPYCGGISSGFSSTSMCTVSPGCGKTSRTSLRKPFLETSTRCDAGAVELAIRLGVLPTICRRS